MRDIFHSELTQLERNLESMASQVHTAMKRAASALRTGDIIVAEQVIDADERINELQRDIDDLCVMLLARQQPVAGDLRHVISALRMAQTLERQGDLARHVAAIARGRYPEHPVPDPLFSLLVKMSDAAVETSASVSRLIEEKDIDLARAISDNDDILDELQRQSFDLIINPELNLSRQQVIDAVLLARFLERFGDHATSVARRVTFLVLGSTEER
ncbi:phosphate signaling complex protein PhoU [Actinomyces vulturis]|uniref:phosphate signaling complex protein PhoU n=1 Tax=Actinomyces vulturis TaxID=1857645 RepID=UPI00082CACFD|nr:phosphate signaling complex protein PhoU [Actinomyces vulturis]